MMRARAWVWGAVGVVLCAGAARTDEPKQAVAWGMPRDGLQAGLYLTLPKESYRVGDRIGFQMKLKNVTDKPVSLSLQKNERWSATLGEGGALRLHPVTQGQDTITLQPGESKDVPGDGGTFLLQHWNGTGKTDEPLIRLGPGTHRVRCDDGLWVPDKDDPNRATGLRARPGEVELKVSAEGQSPLPQPGEKAAAGENAKWGKPVNGIQLGLRFKEGVNRFKVGDTATAELLARNVGDQPLTFGIYKTTEGWWGNTPTIRDAAGQYQRLDVVFLSGFRPISDLTLEPGAAVVVGYPQFEVRAANDTSEATTTPSLKAKPGKYTWTQYESVRPSGGAFFHLMLEAGELEFEVAE